MDTQLVHYTKPHIIHIMIPIAFHTLNTYGLVAAENILQIGYFKHWQKQSADHRTNNDWSSKTLVHKPKISFLCYKKQFQKN